MISRLGNKKCTGCFACVQICPQQCIRIAPDAESFLSPVVDQARCVHCDRCVQACPQCTPPAVHAPLRAYAARIKDDELLKSSTSGGVFALAARTVLCAGGVVFGAAMDANGVVRTVAIESEQALPLLQGSKYVQADTRDAYRQAKQFLQAGREVLFSGTPCQIAGLRGYLGKPYARLYTLDVVCHGVPSQQLYSQYRRWLEKKYHGPVLAWHFRDKQKEGWAQVDRLELKEKTVYQREMLDPYMYAYLKNNCLRESCYACRYAAGLRCGDMTAGDYWGVRSCHPQFYSLKGVSLLTVNTPGGEGLLRRMQPGLHLLQSDYAAMQRCNKALLQPPDRPPAREDFYRAFTSMRMEEFVKTHMKVPFDVKEHIRKAVPRAVRLWVKGKLPGKAGRT